MRRLRRLREEVRSPADVWLALRMAAWALVLPVLKHRVPLMRLARIMWTEPRGGRSPERERKVVTYANWLYRFRRDGFCLEKSLLTYRYLAASGAEPRLAAGMRPDGRQVEGHAWVIVDGDPVHDTVDQLAQLVPVVSFGREGVPSRAARETAPTR